MMNSLFPAVTTALLSVLGPLEAVSVTDGLVPSQDYSNALMIGVDDPDSDGLFNSGAEEQSWHGTGASATTVNDEGDIWVTALAWSGDNSWAIARAAVATILSAVENQLRTDPTLGGVPGLLWVKVGTQQIWKQAYGQHGARAHCSFSIHYVGLI